MKVKVSFSSLKVYLISLLLTLVIILSNIPLSRCDHCCQSTSHWVGDDESKSDDTPPTILEGIQTFQEQRAQECGAEDENCGRRRTRSTSTKEKRYILYEINSGEGFNLRRDIFVRIAPLVKSLNSKISPKFDWILVLPPWQGIPHWRHTPRKDSFPWGTFFSIESIKKYVPVLEWDQFLDEYGFHSGLDVIFSLAHFPFNKNDNSWQDEVKLDPNCDTKPVPFSFQIQKDNSYRGNMWGHPTTTKRIECVSLRGTGSTLLPLIKEEGLRSTAIFLSSAEVLLWDEYGSEEWWRARAALKFASNLVTLAEGLVLKYFSSSSSSPSVTPYLAVHLRRRDFLLRKDGKSLSLKDVAAQIARVCAELKFGHVFIATDADEGERIELIKLLKTISVTMSSCPHNSPPLSEGECAILDQLMCSLSPHFIGTGGSTFTLRIFEERLLHGKTPDSTYNYFCGSEKKTSDCPKPTRWLIPDSAKDLIS